MSPSRLRLTDIRRFDEMNAVWEAWVEKGYTLARATVEARLAGPATSQRSWSRPRWRSRRSSSADLFPREWTFTSHGDALTCR